jgi:3-methyladenine DNA glycosylase AlkD
MTAQAILDEIKPLGRDSYKKILLNHGVKEPCYGVKIEELQKIRRRIRKDYRLALDLYDTGVYDAMYLAGLIADDARMTRNDLRRWAQKASNGGLSGFTVPWVASGSPHGEEMALEWIDSETDHIAAAGWATWCCLMSIKNDADLDLVELAKLLDRVVRTIHQAPNDTRYQMNSFVISLGAYVRPLTESAKAAAEAIGRVTVDMGNTSCKVPFAPDYIRKVELRGSIGKKRKSAKC